jgi:hypothetical protein
MGRGKAFRERLAEDKGLPRVERFSGALERRIGADGTRRVVLDRRTLKSRGESNDKAPAGASLSR